MSRSFSKIRHIQEANQRLEKRTIVEAIDLKKETPTGINQIMELGHKFMMDNNPDGLKNKEGFEAALEDLKWIFKSTINNIEGMRRGIGDIRNHGNEMSSSLEEQAPNVGGVTSLNPKTPTFKSVKDLVNAASSANYTNGTWGTYQRNPGMPEMIFFNGFSPSTMGYQRMKGVLGNMAKAMIDTKGRTSGKWSIKNNTLFLDGEPVKVIPIS